MNKLIIPFVLLMVLLNTSNHTSVPPTVEARSRLSIEVEIDGTKVRDDFREAILSFADEDTPADSIYMPNWLIED